MGKFQYCKIVRFSTILVLIVSFNSIFPRNWKAQVKSKTTKKFLIIFNNYLDLSFFCWQVIDFYFCIHDIYNRDINIKMSIVNFFNNSKKEILVIILRVKSRRSKNVFTEGHNNSSCRDVLFNCLMELEAELWNMELKVVKIYEAVKHH